MVGKRWQSLVRAYANLTTKKAHPTLHVDLTKAGKKTQVGGTAKMLFRLLDQMSK